MRTGSEIEITTELTLIRHGMTASNLEHRYLGRTDEGLSEEGVRELLRKKEGGLYPVPEYLFAGPMTRCGQTAELLFPDREVRIIKEWTEIDFGCFEGKNYEELTGNAAYQRWIDSGGALPFPGGEGREEFIRRTVQGLERMTAFICEAENAENAVNVVKAAAIVHGGTIMALCSRLAGGDYFEYQAGNGEGFQFRLRCKRQGGRTELLLISKPRRLSALQNERKL